MSSKRYRSSKMEGIIAFFFCMLLFGSTGKSLAQNSDELVLEYVHTYSFEKGYYNTFIEATGDTVGLICPNINLVYLINTNTREMDTIEFDKGRGPGEISRGPFGIDFSENNIYLGDPDAQRFSVFDIVHESFRTEVFNSGYPMKTIYNVSGNLMLVDPNASRELAYFLYNPISRKVENKFKLPEKNSDNYRYSGIPAVTEKFLIHANRYYADLIVWDIENGKFIRNSVIESVQRPKAQEARMGNLSGTIPPQNPELKILALTDHVGKENRIFLLMEGKDQKYTTNYIYDYDFIEDEVVAFYEIGAPATLLASSGDNLYVYSEDQDEMYQYKVLAK